MNQPWPFSSITIDVVGVEEDGGWSAVALQMDLIGCGETFDEALQTLKDAVVDQVAFAIQRKQPELILKDAEPAYWLMFDRAKRMALRQMISDDHSAEPVRVGSLAVPPEMLSQARRHRPFKRAYAA